MRCSTCFSDNPEARDHAMADCDGTGFTCSYCGCPCGESGSCRECYREARAEYEADRRYEAMRQRG